MRSIAEDVKDVGKKLKTKYVKKVGPKGVVLWYIKTPHGLKLVDQKTAA
jgi:hypothetical protein